jgi:hypothetical protein
MSRIIKCFCLALAIILTCACFAGCSSNQTTQQPTDQVVLSTYNEYLENSTHLHPERDDILRYALYDKFAMVIECVQPVEHLVIPDTYSDKPVIAIDDNCFANQSKIKSVVFGANILKIGASAFANCTSLMQIKMSSSINEIGDNAFSGCQALTSVIIPPRVAHIPSGIFSGCTSLRKIVIESADRTTENVSVAREIAGGAFTDCSHLSIIWIPEDIIAVPTSIIGGSTPKPLVCGGDATASSYFATQQRLDYKVIARDDFDTHARLYDELDMIQRSPIGSTVKSEYFNIKLDNVTRYSRISSLEAGEDYMFLAVTFSISHNTMIPQYFDGLNIQCISNAPDKNGVITAFNKQPLMMHSDLLGAQYPVGSVPPGEALTGTIVLKVSQRAESVSIHFAGTNAQFVI